MLTRPFATFGAALVLTIGLVACSSDSPLETVDTVAQAETALGNWSDYGNGQCVIGARTFYQKHFAFTLTLTGMHVGNIGECLELGACMYWLASEVQPDPALWTRYAWGSTMPRLYDMVIFPPTSSNGFGHVASVDHLTGTDPSDYSKLWVMDSNWTGTEQVSPAIHNGLYKPYGFYRLKTQEGPHCAPGWGTHLNCGSEPGLYGTDLATLYKCANTTGSAASVVQTCDYGCVISASNTDDACAKVPFSGSIDQASCKSLGGTVLDSAGKPASATVNVYLDAPYKNSGAAPVVTTTSLASNGLWTVATPLSLADGKPHTIYAYAMAKSGPPILLAKSPASLTCDPPTDAGPDADADLPDTAADAQLPDTGSDAGTTPDSQQPDTGTEPDSQLPDTGTDTQPPTDTGTDASPPLPDAHADSQAGSDSASDATNDTGNANSAPADAGESSGCSVAQHRGTSLVPILFLACAIGFSRRRRPRSS